MKPTRTCTVDDCNNRLLARGWCGKHYKRWQIHGDPLYTPPLRPTVCKIDGCDKPIDSYGWCQMHYLRWTKHGDPNNDGGRTLEERFWEKVDKVASGCWEWTGYIDHNGYGKFYGADGRVRMAHRVWYEHTNGDLPEHLQLDHLCRNTRCVNPGHLDPVIAWVNNARSESPSAHHLRTEECPRGHLYDDENTYWRPDGLGRGCRQCRSDTDARRARRKVS